ncbi:MAG: sulfite reductase [Rhodothalassiaceae bacterium]|nr:MAG: sulfite reductase [Rhodothalassiaceae bacterium]
MYRYDDHDRALLAERIAEFREAVAERLAGVLPEEDFKLIRQMHGVYLQMHAYMLRVAIPYGTLDSRQMRALADVARRFDRGYGHFTTRQNIQFNWIRLDEMPAVLERLAEADLHSIQTSGNCIRNVTSDPFAGAAADEATDPRITAELIRQWSTRHPEFSFLPRKFKIAVTASPKDRTAVWFHDIGLIARRDEGGAVVFDVLVGGGQGRTPMIAKVIRKGLPEAELLPYLEAILHVYNRWGRRDHPFKARIKILVHERGIEAMREEVEARFAEILPRFDLDLVAAERARIAAMFAPPPLPARDEAEAQQLLARFAARHPAFARFLRTNVAPHREPGYRIVTVSLKAPGAIPGDATAEQMELVARLAERFSADEIRVTHRQNLVLPHVAAADLPEVYVALKAVGLHHANAGLASDIIACPGLDYCVLANARSIPIAQRIAERLAQRFDEEDIGHLEIKISGCINACGHHHAGHIGVLGVDRKGEERYQLLLGGSGAEDAAIATITGPGFDEEGIVRAVETVVETWLKLRRPGERFLDTFRRTGLEPFKEALYVPA